MIYMPSISLRIWERSGLDLQSLVAFRRGMGWICRPWRDLGDGWVGFNVLRCIFENSGVDLLGLAAFGGFVVFWRDLGEG